MQPTTRPRTILTIIAMLILLALVSVATLATSRLMINPARSGLPGGAPPAAGSFQSGGQPGAMPERIANGQRRPAQGGLNLFSLTRSLGLNPQVLGYTNLALPLTGIVLLLVSIAGIWRQKGWALNLATVLVLVYLLGALPGLLSLGGRNINWLRTATAIVSAAATLPVLALSLLPSVREYFPPPVKKPRAGQASRGANLF